MKCILSVRQTVSDIDKDRGELSDVSLLLFGGFRLGDRTLPLHIICFMLNIGQATKVGTKIQHIR